MNLKLESIMPFAIVGFLAFTFYFNAKPPEYIGDKKVIAPTMEAPKLIRDEGVVDGKVQIKHLPSGNSLNFDFYDGYFLLPPGKDSLPLGEDGSKLWEFKYTKPTYWIDPRFEIGAYAGFLDGGKEGTDIKPFDVGLKLSPTRLFFDSTTVDALVSNQGAGLGLSFYPSPARFGPAWRNLGLGYGRVYTYDDGAQRNLFYLTISSHF
jgi:hypothetical protein